jgi:hypothetical protein
MRARTLDEARFVNLQRPLAADKTRFDAVLRWSADARMHTVKTPAKIFLWDSKKKCAKVLRARLCKASKRDSHDSSADSDRRSDAEFGLQKLVNSLRIGLTAGLFHDLSDEPSKH